MIQELDFFGVISINSGPLKRYEAEKINGTSLNIKETFNFLQPSCPNMKDGTFKDFTCFDYLEDTVRTKEETTTNTPMTTPPPEAIPSSHIAIMSGFGAAIFLVIIAIVIYKIRQK